MAHTFISETDKLSPQQQQPRKLKLLQNLAPPRLQAYQWSPEAYEPNSNNRKSLERFFEAPHYLKKLSSSTEVRASTPSLRSSSSSVGNNVSSMNGRIAECSSTSSSFIVRRVVPIRRTHVHIVLYYVPGFQCTGTFPERTFGVLS